MKSERVVIKCRTEREVVTSDIEGWDPYDPVSYDITWKEIYGDRYWTHYDKD